MSQARKPEFEVQPERAAWDNWRQVLIEVAAESIGLQVGQLVDLLLAVEQAERLGRIPLMNRPETRTGQKGAIELFLRGWEQEKIDIALGFPDGATARVIDSAKIHPKAHAVVAAHAEGHSPSRIGRDHGIGQLAVERILRSIREEPHRVRNMARSADINHAVIRLYKDLRRAGGDRVYRQIADKLGISERDVRNRLAYARKKGRITDPPMRRSNVKRRRPRAAE